MTSTYDDPNPVGHVENPMSSSTDAFQAAAAAVRFRAHFRHLLSRFCSSSPVNIWILSQVEVGEKFVNPVSGRTLRKKDKGAEREQRFQPIPALQLHLQGGIVLL